MHPLDILSDSPSLYILEKGSNKTNFGGFLFIIYLALIIMILVYYYFDYTKNDKFTIQSFSHFNFKTEEEKEKRNEDPLFNPYINFKIDLGVRIINKTYSINNKNFKLYDNKREEFIERSTIFNKRISDFEIIVFYDCEYENCSDYYEYLDFLKILNNNYTVRDYYLLFEYDSFNLEHQNEEKPIIKTKVDKESLYKLYKLNLNSTTEIRFKWKNIIYTEKKGIRQKNTKDSCGYIENYNIIYYEKLFKSELTERRGRYLFSLCEIYFSNDNIEYTEYFRKKISLLDIAANILSLMANFFTGAKIILRFYSNSFTNFKIIEKILNRQDNIKYKIYAPSELNDFDNNKFISIKDDFTEKCIDKNKNRNNTEEIYDVNKEYIEEDDENNSNKKRIHKLRFFDFFLNNIYCCLKKQRKQNIINMCNQIVYKYASIDALIKNQILVENFLKDYKWNDPKLNNVENNNLFIQLKTFL